MVFIISFAQNLFGAYLCDQIIPRPIIRSHFSGAHLSCTHLSGAIYPCPFVRCTFVRWPICPGPICPDARLSEAHLSWGTFVLGPICSGAHLPGPICPKTCSSQVRTAIKALRETPPLSFLFFFFLQFA